MQDKGEIICCNTAKYLNMADSIDVDVIRTHLAVPLAPLYVPHPAHPLYHPQTLLRALDRHLAAPLVIPRDASVVEVDLAVAPICVEV